MKSARKTKSITFSGIAMALIVVMLFMAGIVDILDYTISAICGLVITFILVEFGTSPAICAYLGSSILSLLLVPSKINAILFVAFCGWYPFIKRYLERIREPFGTILKFAVFNISLTVIIFITVKVLLIEAMSPLWYITLYLVSNLTFILYDVLITKIIWIYVHKYRPKLKFLTK